MFFSPYFEFGNWRDQASVAKASAVTGASESSKIWYGKVANS